MGQITIDLDHDLERQLKSMASAAGMSISCYIAERLDLQIQNHWPQSVQNFPGTWDQSVKRPTD